MMAIDKNFDQPVESFHHTDHWQTSDFCKHFSDKFLKDFEGLWNSKRFSDFTIIVGAKEFLVHKTVLGSQSSFFAAMFESDVEEMRTGKMTITDFSAEAVEEFLRHFYTGELPSVANFRRKKSKTEETCTVKEETKKEHEELLAEKRKIRRPKRFLN
jgi:BTB/POZ domain